MKKSFLFLYSLIGLALLSSCEDVINIDLHTSTARLSVDAWLQNTEADQTIKLRTTTAYLDTTPAPAITGAVVSVTDNEGKVYNFYDVDNIGNYIWKPAANEKFGKIGNSYTLNISYNGQSYQAVSKMNPVCKIDSISYEFRKDQLGTDDGYYGILNAYDLPETGNCYWIRAYKNGKYLNKSGEINIAFDAGFKNSNVNNQPFIIPIAEGINPEVVDRKPPYAIGDSIYVEIWSITDKAYDFINQAKDEMSNGGLFATIPSNVPSNIKNQDENSDKTAVGFFNVSAVSTSSVKLK